MTKRILTNAQFHAAVAFMGNFNEDRLEAARLILVEDESYRSVLKKFGWASVGSFQNVRNRVIEHYELIKTSVERLVGIASTGTGPLAKGLGMLLLEWWKPGQYQGNSFLHQLRNPDAVTAADLEALFTLLIRTDVSPDDFWLTRELQAIEQRWGKRKD